METSITHSQAMTEEMVTPKELVKRHIADPTHKITEEEMRKVVVGVLPNESNHSENRFFNEADKLSLR